MKKMILAAFATLSLVQSAQAKVMTRTLRCESDKLIYAYDGPRADKLTGGAYTIRDKVELDNSVLAGDENLGQRLGDDYGHNQLELITKAVFARQVGRVVTETGKAEQCATGGLMIEKSKVGLILQVTAVSNMAAKSLNLKVGQAIELDCQAELITHTECESR